MKLRIRLLIINLVIIATCFISTTMAKYIFTQDIAELSLQAKYSSNLTATNADASVNSGYKTTQIINSSFEEFVEMEQVAGRTGWTQASSANRLAYNK